MNAEVLQAADTDAPPVGHEALDHGPRGAQEAGRVDHERAAHEVGVVVREELREGRHRGAARAAEMVRAHPLAVEVRGGGRGRVLALAHLSHNPKPNPHPKL